MEKTVSIFVDHLKAILQEQLDSVYLYGSCVMDDFRPGWSDIDVLCFTSSPPTPDQAKQLLYLRQSLAERYSSPLFRAIEGVVISLPEFASGTYSRLVYWGTSGQRITASWQADVFSLYSLGHFSRCIYGAEDRAVFPDVSFPMLVDGIRAHLETIRKYAQQTDDSLYSCGWLLDIARCLYTLRYQTITSKTAAGIWALEQHLCPDPAVLEQTLAIRQNPSEHANNPSTKKWLKTLGPAVQRFADVLES